MKITIDHIIYVGACGDTRLHYDDRDYPLYAQLILGSLAHIEHLSG